MSSIETRLAAAGLPPLPRTAWLEIDLDALRGNLAALRSLAGDRRPGPPRRQGRRLRSRCRAGGARPRGRGRGRVLRGGVRRGGGASKRRDPRPDPGALSDPGRARRGGGPPARRPCRAGTRTSWRPCWRPRRPRRPPTPPSPSTSSSRWRPGWVVVASRPRPSRPRPPRSRARHTPGSRGCGPTSRRARTRIGPAISWRASRPRRRACATPGCPSPHAMSRPVAGSSPAWRPSTASDRDSRSTGSCPTSSPGVP